MARNLDDVVVSVLDRARVGGRLLVDGQGERRRLRFQAAAENRAAEAFVVPDGPGLAAIELARMVGVGSRHRPDSAAGTGT
ncbi:MAG TPA: hypothetical protein PKA16_05075 [Ottowia sp.]|uniref:hypothetical protein n=1 Tax=Ottowia sp. TaxID=1898956 RepID=UPI002C86F284|nr:hypothetical protein [Ottowia sp.]HMN20746.1 hypothetical protein [Ottowia sp.]